MTRKKLHFTQNSISTEEFVFLYCWFFEGQRIPKKIIYLQMSGPGMKW